MIDITHKSTTLREAIAEATVTASSTTTIDVVVAKKVPKGDVLEAARIAGLFGVKRTSDMIPDCHPLPVEHTEITFEVTKNSIIIKVKVRTIYRTGVEVEAMHGASVAALTIYDMLKPIDKGISIDRIRLVEKTGGKSDWKDDFQTPPKAAILICSDQVAAGKKNDTGGAMIKARLQKLNVNVIATVAVPDDATPIKDQIAQWTALGVDVIITTGGTGLSPRDNTPDVIAGLLDREIPGIMETARAYGQERMPLAIMSRGIAGMIGRTLVLTLPGSTRGAQETMDALFPFVLHVLKVQEKAFRHGQ